MLRRLICVAILLVVGCKRPESPRADSASVVKQDVAQNRPADVKPMVIDTTLKTIFGVALRTGQANAPWCLVTSRTDIWAGRKVLVLWPSGAMKEFATVDDAAPGCAVSEYPMGDVYRYMLDIPGLRERTAFRSPGLVVSSELRGGERWRDGFFVTNVDDDEEPDLIQQCYGIATLYYYVTSYPSSSRARWSVKIPLEGHRQPDCVGRFGEPLTDTTTVIVKERDPVPPGAMNVPWGQQADSLPLSTPWLALRVRDGKWRLEATSIEYLPADGPCGEEEGGRVARPRDGGEWLAMFASLPALSAGPVEHAVIADTSDRDLTLQNDSSIVHFRGRRVVLRGETTRDGVRITVHDEGDPVIVFAEDYEDEGSWRPMWAGDLDRDGKLDLLLDATWKYSIDAWHLLLSTHRTAGRRWWPSARYGDVAC